MVFQFQNGSIKRVHGDFKKSLAYVSIPKWFD